MTNATAYRDTGVTLHAVVEPYTYLHHGTHAHTDRERDRVGKREADDVDG